MRVPAERQTLAATVEFKNLMKDGAASASLPATLPGRGAPPDYPGRGRASQEAEVAA